MLLSILQVIIFLALLIHSVQLMAASGLPLRPGDRLQEAGPSGVILAIRLARNLLGLILVTASTAPHPAMQDLVPQGILVFLTLAVLNVVLTHLEFRGSGGIPS